MIPRLIITAVVLVLALTRPEGEEELDDVEGWLEVPQFKQPVNEEKTEKNNDDLYTSQVLAIQGRSGYWLELLEQINWILGPAQEDLQETEETTYVNKNMPSHPFPPLSPNICGKRPGLARGLARIVGGTEAVEGEVPWQAGLVMLPLNRKVASVIHCGGTLASPYAVVTAAHCLQLPAARYQVVVGKLGSNLAFHECHQQELVVVTYHLHPQFEPQSLKNDIAVVAVTSEYGQGAAWSKWVLPACLPSIGGSGYSRLMWVEGEIGVVSGWGATAEADMKKAEMLRLVELPLLEHSKCLKAYQDMTQVSNDSQFCAGVVGGGRDACFGDSGGPIVSRVHGPDMEERFYLAGVVSFGKGCGRAAYPGVFTRLEPFLPWLLEKVEQAGREASGWFNSSEVSSRASNHNTSTTISTTKNKTTSNIHQSFLTLSNPKKTTVTTMKTLTSTSTDVNITSEMIESTTPIPPTVQSFSVGPICSGQHQVLRCPTDSTITMISAIFGRTSLEFCPTPGLLTTPCWLTNATLELATACGGQRACLVSTEVQGRGGPWSRNPCFLLAPYVMVEYSC